MDADEAERSVRDASTLLDGRGTPNDADLQRLVQFLSELDPKRRKGFRAQMLQRAFTGVAALAKALAWHGGVVVRDGEVLVDQDGALFHADSRFFRKQGAPPARKMLAVARRFGGAVQTVFDIGANIGEIALYLAVQLPEARVFAFEPAAENIAAFRANLALQARPLANLTLVEEAVSARRGSIAMTAGAGDLNTAIVERNVERLRARDRVAIVQVPSDTLSGYAGRFGVDTIDFMKVDIEGGEPLLSGAIRELRGRIGVCLFEMSRFNGHDEYVELDAALRAAGLTALDYELRRIEDFGEMLAERLTLGSAVNIWYVRDDLLSAAR